MVSSMLLGLRLAEALVAKDAKGHAEGAKASVAAGKRCTSRLSPQTLRQTVAIFAV